VHVELEVRWDNKLEPLPLVAFAGFFAQTGLKHQLAESGSERLVYVLIGDVHPVSLMQLIHQELASSYALEFDRPDDNRLVCRLAVLAPEPADGGLDGEDLGPPLPSSESAP